jgi:hypothetical protein
LRRVSTARKGLCRRTDLDLAGVEELDHGLPSVDKRGLKVKLDLVDAILGVGLGEEVGSVAVSLGLESDGPVLFGVRVSSISSLERKD